MALPVFRRAAYAVTDHVVFVPYSILNNVIGLVVDGSREVFNNIRMVFDHYPP